MLSKLKKITTESKQKLEEAAKGDDEIILNYLLGLAENAYTQLEETAEKGKNRKYVIGYDNMYKLEDMFMNLNTFKCQEFRFRYCEKHIERISKKFIEKMGNKFDVPLKFEPSFYSSYERRIKYWYSENCDNMSYMGDIYFDWSDQKVTPSDQPDEDTSC